MKTFDAATVNTDTNVTTTSTQWTLNARDFLRGAIMFVGSAVVAILYELLIRNGGNIREVNWEHVGGAAVIALITYLAKNLQSKGTVVVEAPEVAVKAVDKGQATATIVSLENNSSYE